MKSKETEAGCDQCPGRFRVHLGGDTTKDCYVILDRIFGVMPKTERITPSEPTSQPDGYRFDQEVTVTCSGQYYCVRRGLRNIQQDHTLPGATVVS